MPCTGLIWSQVNVFDHNAFGDFEFAREGTGSQFDAFVCIGDGVYVMCNNLYTTMAEITKDAQWLRAQKPFVELSEYFRSNPVTFTA